MSDDEEGGGGAMQPPTEHGEAGGPPGARPQDASTKNPSNKSSVSAFIGVSSTFASFTTDGFTTGVLASPNPGDIGQPAVALFELKPAPTTDFAAVEAAVRNLAPPGVVAWRTATLVKVTAASSKEGKSPSPSLTYRSLTVRDGKSRSPSPTMTYRYLTMKDGKSRSPNPSPTMTQRSITAPARHGSDVKRSSRDALRIECVLRDIYQTEYVRRKNELSREPKFLAHAPNDCALAIVRARRFGSFFWTTFATSRFAENTPDVHT